MSTRNKAIRKKPFLWKTPLRYTQQVQNYITTSDKQFCKQKSMFSLSQFLDCSKRHLSTLAEVITAKFDYRQSRVLRSRRGNEIPGAIILRNQFEFLIHA